MRGGRILWGQIAVVLTIVFVIMWAATQWTAWRLGCQAQLGSPWFELAGWPIYYPPAFFWWWFSFDAYAPAIFTEGGIVAVSGGLFAIVAAITMSIIRSREARNVATYGSARWAEDKEIRAAGLLGPDGVVLGRYDRDYLRHNGPEHVLCFAPTRSGKGVGLVVPTLLTWPGSCIVHDIKGENWTLTAGFRAKHGRVFLFDPTNAQSSAYNPLLEVRQGEWEVRDVQNIADILVDPVITTDRRTYMVELRSGEKPYMPAVSWSYPQPAGGGRQAIPATPIIPAVAARNYRYGLTGSSNPPWKPVAVYDDGRRVYVEFPRGIVQGEMPPIFVIGPEGEAQIANTRIYQHILIVDRLFGAAELRLGGSDRQQTVRIIRTDGRPQS